MDEYPVIVKATVGRATEPVNGIRSLEIDYPFHYFNLQGISFGDEVIAAELIEDPDHPGFAKFV